MSSQKSNPPVAQTILNRRTTQYEFLGPPGAILVSVLCPVVLFGLIFLCNEKGCPPRDISTWQSQLPTSLFDLIDWKAIKWYFSFQIGLVMLWLVLPGKWVQ